MGQESGALYQRAKNARSLGEKNSEGDLQKYPSRKYMAKKNKPRNQIPL